MVSHKLKLHSKINILFITILLLFSTIIFLIVSNQVEKEIKTEALVKAKSNSALGYRYINQKYPGDWEIRNGKLYKGDILINGNHQIVEEIRSITGSSVTINQGGVRVATTVFQNGKRAEGTTLDPMVIEQVLHEGKDYTGQIDIMGELHQVYYTPIKSKEGENIGIWFVGVPNNQIDLIRYSFSKFFIGILGLLFILSLLMIIIFSKRISKRFQDPLNDSNDTEDKNVIKKDSEHIFGKSGVFNRHFLQIRKQVKRLFIKNSSKHEKTIIKDPITHYILNTNPHEQTHDSTHSPIMEEIEQSIKRINSRSSNSAELSSDMGGVVFWRTIAILIPVFALLTWLRFYFDPIIKSGVADILFQIAIYILLIISISMLIRIIVKEKENTYNLTFSLAKSLDTRDRYTAHHSDTVADYALKIAMELKLPKKQCEEIYLGGLLHDIGKIGIPESILNKPSKLTADEFEVIKTHPAIGYEIVKHIPTFKKNGVLEMILHHHERYDGKGYPYRLKGEGIPLGARIICVADSFDAMISRRIYRESIPLLEVIEELKSNKEKQFDPKIVDIFIKILINEGKFNLENNANTSAAISGLSPIKLRDRHYE